MSCIKDGIDKLLLKKNDARNRRKAILIYFSMESEINVGVGILDDGPLKFRDDSN